MKKLKFNKNRLEEKLRMIFPNSKIKNYEKFKTGITSSSTFKVNIINPKKSLAVKLSKLGNRKRIEKNNQILNYLRKNKIPAPKIFFSGVFDKKFITIMENIEGDVASEMYKRNKKLRKKILISSGRVLNQIHSLKIPKFWSHQHHEIKGKKEWKKWTELRVKKYLQFFQKKFLEYHPFLKKELSYFLNIIKNENIKFVPLHWDYHLSNINVNNKGKIIGVFDFENAMKGHNLADIGQTAYWIKFYTKDYKNFEYFLRGYKKNFSKKELDIIKGYFLLHLLAVSRTIWRRQPRLNWIIREHKKILDEIESSRMK